jgi:hypothetical protein
VRSLREAHLRLALLVAHRSPSRMAALLLCARALGNDDRSPESLLAHLNFMAL